ncbi:MAG: carbonic anhydrase [Magnetococcales bacterium]|nr:carbonic anhydrase [Magnetococcales bacterium]HIJ85901.1 carbonic anhydrase [Magnetococcales bacterium]
MNRTSFFAAIVLIFGGFTLANAEEKDVEHLNSHWGYAGATGPENWGSLSPKYSTCSQGANQSPINLKNFTEANLPPIEFIYNSQATEILNNGHTVQVNFPPSTAAIRVDDTTFELKQVHFHAPAENQIDSRFFDMEAHFVHADASGNLAVVALMMQNGESNIALEGLWGELPAKADGPHSLSTRFFAQQMLPVEKDYYRFSGSLTTPPCTEGVRWLVLKQPVPVSAQQVKAFTALVGGHGNNRPVQPINARTVLR